MKIRESQFQAFADGLRIQAENELVAHCHQFAPQSYRAAGENGVRQAVRLGFQRAQGYGFETQDHVRFYVDLMLVLGSDFDSDPQFPWAAEILQDPLSKTHVRAIMLHRDL